MGIIVSQPQPPQCSKGQKDISDYRVYWLNPIGTGSYGQVYGAVHRGSNRKVAVKKLYNLPESGISEEVKALKQVKHGNIVEFLEYCTHDKHGWIFMEYCPQDLSSFLEEKCTISMDEKFDIMCQLALAVRYLHYSNPPIIHRDIKPENVLMTTSENRAIAKLTDFGFAKIMASNSSMMKSGIYKQKLMSIKGTPFYMAPELIALDESDEPENEPYTASVDVFSLALLYVVIIEYGKENQSLLPLSVESKRKNKKVVVGREMNMKHESDTTRPQVVEILLYDEKRVKKLKRLILHMTVYEGEHRPHMRKVVQSLNEMERRLSTTILSIAETPSPAAEATGNFLDNVPDKYIVAGGVAITSLSLAAVSSNDIPTSVRVLSAGVAVATACGLVRRADQREAARLDEEQKRIK